MPTRKISRYGWRPDHPDRRDRKFSIEQRVNLPAQVDLSKLPAMPPIYDQGELGSCTANAIAAAVDFERGIQKETFITPSRLFIYYNERAIEGATAEDSGAELRDGIKVVANSGVCPESEWPYEISHFAEQPPAHCFADALHFKALQYSSVTQDPYFVRHCLAILGKPVAFGMSVYDAFESDDVAATGVVPMPAANEAPVGGHAVLLVGYDDASQRFKVRNSWGADWGSSGYFTIPYRFVLDPDLASDFWTITLES